MDIHCVDNWLYHRWGPDGRCIRGCGATGPLYRGSHLAVTSGDDQFLSASLSTARPVDPADQHGSRHPQHSKADDSSFAVFVGSLACSEALWLLQ
jgi:hypothetical protein